MAKGGSIFICTVCGAQSPQWSGRCDSCGEWNTLTRETRSATGAGGTASRQQAAQLTDLAGKTASLPPRLITGIAEFDRVTGGGLVPGSAVLIGGDPGIGKSTLLLQAMAALGGMDHKVIYISGEEAVAQVRLRAQRMGLDGANVALAVETDVETILATLAVTPPPAVVVIDSIQTLSSAGAPSAPGSVTQLRVSTQALIHHAKATGICLLLVGHVTKEGQIAGPKLIEHMVDTVLYFEGDGDHQCRILRTVKNRFGPTDEIGVFEMTDKGLAPIADPSSFFLGARETGAPGAAIFAGIEGTRPLLMEIQALVTPSRLATPRRAVVGWHQTRLAMVLAVLEARAGLSSAGHDVYLNVAGGLKPREPAADLAGAAAVISSLANKPLPGDTVFFGEIALSGAIRPVSRSDARLREAEKLGFRRGVIAAGRKTPYAGSMTIRYVSHAAEFGSWIAGLDVDG